MGEAAEALGVSSTTLRWWEAAGKLAVERMAVGHWRYDVAKLRPELFRAGLYGGSPSRENQRRSMASGRPWGRRNADRAQDRARSEQCAGDVSGSCGGHGAVCVQPRALAEWRRQYGARKADDSLPKPTRAALRRRLDAIKREQLGFAGKIMPATVSGVADRWYVGIAVDTPDASHLAKADAEGVDLGVSALATLLTGEKVSGPKACKALPGRRRGLSRGLSRKVKGSASRRKAKAKVAKLHASPPSVWTRCTSSRRILRAGSTPSASGM